MKKSILFLFILLAIIMLIFIFPKPNGGGGSCIGCINEVCKCFGYKKGWRAAGPWKSFCFGVSHSCYTYKEGYRQ